MECFICNHFQARRVEHRIVRVQVAVSRLEVVRVVGHQRVVVVVQHQKDLARQALVQIKITFRWAFLLTHEQLIYTLSSTSIAITLNKYSTRLL